MEPGSSPAATSVFLEREAELAAIAGLIEELRSGDGEAILVEGPAGVGKTRLLHAARRAAQDCSVAVFAARGGELERAFAFGVVRQLFEPALRTVADDERAMVLEGAAELSRFALDPGAEGQPAPEAILHGLYWLAVSLADRRRTLLVVDDAHWSDLPSLRFLLYLVRRLEGLPLGIVLAARSEEPGGRRELIAELAQQPRVRVLTPAPLGRGATHELLARALSSSPGEGFVAACHETTGGNPFLLVELASTLRQEALEPADVNAPHVWELSPAAVGRSVKLRLARLGGGASALAGAVAVLGGEASLRRAAQFAELDNTAAATAADLLQAVGILRQSPELGFVHPLLRRAVYDSIPQGERSLAHGRAARLLDREGAPREEIAGHLLEAEARSDPWTVDQLEGAARKAASVGAPEAAANYLRRALVEPPDAAVRRRILRELGVYELRAGRPEALEHLRAAVDEADDPRERALALLEWAKGSAGSPSLHPAVVRALEDEIARIHGLDRELELQLEAQLSNIARTDLSLQASVSGRLERLAGEVTGRTPAERQLLAAAAAGEPAGRARSAAEAAELVERAVAGGLSIDYPGYGQAVLVLLYADRLELAEELFTEALRAARANGSAATFALACALRGTLALFRGALLDAEAEARAGYEVVSPHDARRPPLLSILIEVAVDTGDLSEAAALLEAEHVPEALPEVMYYSRLLYARGRLRLAQGDRDGALRDLLELGRRYEQWGIGRPLPPWRSTAAIALAAQGEQGKALTLANEELALARSWGTPRTIGVAAPRSAHAA